MANFIQQSGNRPGYWRAFGHSYLENQLGTADQTGRPDGVFRDIMSIQGNEWQNWAVTGSVLMKQGVSQGGYARLLQAIPGAIRGAPYVSNGGASLLCWGINDMGKAGTDVTFRSAYIDALRTAISRCRMSSIKENSDGSVAYGAGFTLATVSGEWTSGVDYRTATATTNANFTITLPADYDGSTVVLCFNGIVNGGTGTFSGTAGVTGTFSTSAIIPASQASHAPRIKRITNLTSANAGQTIIFTANSFDSTGSIDFDCWWIESKTPPPVIIMDIVKLNSTGYAGFPQLSGNSVAVNDGLIDVWNTAINQLAVEFDTMVQVALCDDAIGKNPLSLWSVDGVHPTEFGSASLADAIAEAARKLEPPAGNTFSTAAYINAPSPRGGAMVRLHRAATWYTAEYGAIAGTGITMVAGDMYAIPFQVTNPRRRVQQFALEVTTASTTTGATVRWGLYDDPDQQGYPFSLMQELTSGGTFSVGISSTGVKTSPTPPTAGSIDKPLDAGVFWLVFKCSTIGVGTSAGVVRALAGNNLLMPNASTTGLPLATGTGFMGWLSTGQGAGALPSRFTTGAALSASVPYVGFKFQ